MSRLPHLYPETTDLIVPPSPRPSAAVRRIRVDSPRIDPNSIWAALTRTEGVGVSITDTDGRLLFVNDTALVLFSQATDIDYEGKCIGDFHSPEFVVERLSLIARVLEEAKPLAMRHIYHGRRIHSTVWPICDTRPPFNRVIVISRAESGHDRAQIPEAAELVRTDFIGLGQLDVLTQREVEVAVLLGHGISVPKVAKLLYRSPKTIQRHKASISAKLNIHGQADLVAIVTEMGLDLDDAKLRRYPKL